jgi:hypothetical protein
VGTLFVDFIPSSLIMKFQFFRSMIFLKLFAALYLGNFLRQELWSESFLSRVLAVGLACSLREPEFLGLIGGVVAFREARKGGRAVLLVLAVSLPLLSIAYEFLKGRMAAGAWDGILRNAAIFLGCGAALAVLWGLFLNRLRSLSEQRPLGLAAPVAGLAGLLLLIPAVAALDHRSPGILSERVKTRLTIDSEWDRLCEWIRLNTPRDAVFIIPPDVEDFRLRAERALFVDFKSSPFSETETLEWWRRMQRLIREKSPPTVRGDIQDYLRDRYENLGQRDFEGISRDYGASFVLSPKTMALGLPIVHISDHWTLYRIGA